MRKIAVESPSARRRLKEAGFDDEQSQAVIDVTGTRDEWLALEADMSGLKQDVTVLKEQTAALNERFDGFRDEIVARLDASEERVKSEVASLRGELAAFRTEIRSELRGEITAVRGQIAELRAGTDARIDGIRDEMRARFDGVEGRLKLIVWLMGAGLTLYTATTISLMILLFRAVLA